MDLFTSLINKNSHKDKNALDGSIQNIEPTWHLSHARKSNKTQTELDALQEGTGFTIIGDPVGELKNDTKYFLCKCNECSWIKNIGISYLRKKTVNCKNCFNVRLSKEAKNYNLKLNGLSTDGNIKRRNYTFIRCGHIRNIAYSDVRVGQVSCTECYSLLVDEKMEEYGFINLGRPSKYETADITQDYKVIQSCGHERIVKQNALINNRLGQCKNCYEDHLQAECNTKYNVTIIKGTGDTKRLIRFNNCLHEKEVRLTNLKNGNFRCNICTEQRWKQEAQLSELSWIRNSNKDYCVYKAPCGHELRLRASHVRIGHWTCRECNAGSYNRPSYLYLFEVKTTDGFDFLKLGYGMKPEYRKNDYILSEGVTTDLLIKVKVKTGLEAVRVEQGLHKKYKSFNLKSKEIKKYLTESGFTECYPIDLKSVLLKDLNEIGDNIEQY